MRTTLRPFFACCAAGALAIALAGCEPDEKQQATSSHLALAEGLAPGWSMMDLAGVDPEIYGSDEAALPQAVPMTASYSGGDYGYAPMYDYAPDDERSYYAPLDDSYYYDDGYEDAYYDDGYYGDGYYDEPYDSGYSDGGLLGLGGGDLGGLGLLAVVTALTGVLGDAPPDYGFSYDGLSPWAWQTGDRYYRYAEPVYGGYRYYYYEPDAYRPFFVSDPYYSYGYRDDRVVVIYDRDGRRIDERRAQRQLDAAREYYERAERLHRAAQRDRYGVPAPLWERQRNMIARDRRDWFEQAYKKPAVRQWEARNAPKLERRWASEALVRRDAERRFADWQRAGYRTPAPKFYTPQARQEQVRRVAELRQERPKEVAERRRELVEQRREVRQEAQRMARAERPDRTSQRGPHDGVREQAERQRFTPQPIRAREARELAGNDRARIDDRRTAAAPSAARQAPERAKPQRESSRSPIATRREERQAAQSQRVADRVVAERRAEAVKAQRQAAADRSARAARTERQNQQAQQRQNVQQEARAERARQAAARQQEQAKAAAERRERATREASANANRQAAERREAQARERQAQAAQRQKVQAEQRQRVQDDERQRRQQAQAEQRQQAQADQRQRAAAERQQAQAERQRAQAEQRQRAQSEQRDAQARQRQAEAQQRQQARSEQREQARQERQGARETRREAHTPRRGERG